MSTTTSIHEHAVVVDTLLAKTYTELADVHYNIEREENQLHRLAKHTYDRKVRSWTGTLDDAIAYSDFVSDWERNGHAGCIEKRTELLAQRAELLSTINVCNTNWELNGRWSRFYLVTNTNGHIHSSTTCSTCYPTPQYAWLTSLSGLREEDAVKAEGEILCSVCFPSAPVAWTNGISRRDAEAKAQREAEKAERQRKKAEKSLSLDGDVVTIRTEGKSYYNRKEFKTLRSAELWLIEAYAYATVEAVKSSGGVTTWWASAPDAYSEENLEYVVSLYAQKTGTSTDEVIANALKKARIRLKKSN